MFKKTKLSTGLLLAFGSVLMVGAPAVAQEVQRVEVVGSNIKRINAETAVPVTIVTREEIQRSSASTVQELLQNMGVSGSQGFESQGAASFVTGASAVGLRGLSAGDTLVLLNGRRIAPYASAQQSSSDGAVGFVDLNSLPLSAVEQIQVLKDGASAIYGADAIAGVINVITRKEYSGVEVYARAGFYPGKSGGKEMKAGITTGFGDFSKDGYNLLLNFEAGKTNSIAYADRDLSKTFDHRAVAPYMGDQRSAFSDYGNYSVDGGAFQAGTNCPATRLRSGACRYDFGAVESLQPSIDRISFLSVGNLAINDRVTAFGELAYNRNQIGGNTRAPAMDTSTDFFQVDAYRGLPLGTTSDLIKSALASQVPAGLLSGASGSTLDVRTRFTDNGPRKEDITATNMRLLGGVKGTFNDWDWETALTQSISKVSKVDGNEIRKDLLADLMVAGSVNLWGINKSGYDSARYVASDKGEMKMQMVDAKASGAIGKLPGGDIMLAVGGEYRKESISSQSDPYSASGLKLGSAATGTDGSRNLKSIFAEVSLPVIKELEVTLAARHDRYSDFGGTTNPKLAVGFRPTKNLLVRASYGTAFKAPTLFQLFEAQAAGGYEELIDPWRCAVTSAVEDCDGRLIESRSGGALLNGIDLKPEESKNANLGIVIEPIDNVTVALDLWQIRKKNAITQNSAQGAIDSSVNSPLVVRNPAVGGVPGSVVRVIQSYFNADRQNLRGVDLDVSTRWRSASGDKFTLGTALTYLDKFWVYSDNIGCSPCNWAGNFEGPAANPRMKGNATFSWTSGPLSWTLQGNYLGKYNYVTWGQKAAGAKTVQAAIHDRLTFDTSASYTGIKNLELRMGVRNLMDKEVPPMAFYPAGWDTATYDGRGRFVYFAGNYSFK